MVYRRLKFTLSIPLLCLLILCAMTCPGFGYPRISPVKIGVLAKRGTEQAVHKWQPTADYLGQAILQRTFIIVPLWFDEVKNAVSDRHIDFLLANPSIYVEMEHDFQINRIATIKNLQQGKGYTQFGGVVFSRADHPLARVEDLHGKSFMAVDPTSFGGAAMAWRELLEDDFDPFADFGSLEYGNTHDAVVFAVRDGRVDAGTVRTDTLERMAAEGEIDLDNFHVIRLRQMDDERADFPFLCSTRLYPEWPMAKLAHVPEELARQVTIALFGLEPAHPAARAGRIAGWTIPQHYQDVHECLRILHLGPYSSQLQLSAGQIFNQYRVEILGVFALLVLTTCSMVYFRTLGQKLQQSEQKSREAHAELDQLFHASADAVRRVDTELNVLRINHTYEKMTGFTAKEIIGRKCHETFPGPACGTWKCPPLRIFNGEDQVIDEIAKRSADGREIPCLVFAVPYRDQDGKIIGAVEYYRDISILKQTQADLQQSRDALNDAYQELQHSQTQVLQQEKMATIGQLAAGVAHEINNPLGFIGSNLSSLNKYWKKLCEYMGYQKELLADLVNEEQADQLDRRNKQLKIDFVVEDTEDLINESLEGVEQVKSIVANLKSFSRVDQAKYDLADINQCLETTLNILRNELKYSATLHKDYALLPLTYCYPQQLNQVFMNLLVNAGHAIGSKGNIHIVTRTDNERILISIRDDGCGIPEENLIRLFEPFFTTKDVGKGTGLGLSIAYDIIDRHKGKLQVDSRLGEGSTFTITLPVVESISQQQE